MAWLRKPKPKEGCKANWKEKTKKKKKGRKRIRSYTCREMQRKCSSVHCITLGA
jgi:hypothetical protein